MSHNVPNSHDSWRFPAAPTAVIQRHAYLSRELAESLGVSLRTVKYWEATGIAPPSVKLGRLRLYPTDLVRQWLADKALEQECSAETQREIGSTEETAENLDEFNSGEDSES